MADWSVVVVIYIVGVLTGAALTGWSPAVLDRWKEEKRERRRQGGEMIELARRQAARGVGRSSA
jgi:type II secretory pathway pseudopilin PulG